MKPSSSDITTRTATLDDAQELCALLNQIIEIGGTTAFETPLTVTQFSDCFLRGPEYWSCYVAVDTRGALAGFQALKHHAGLRDDWADIATFARAAPKVTGVGKALFERTKAIAHQLGVKAINATIRADNEGGLSYYERIGFVTYAVKKGVPLNDGTPVDRISKQFFVSGQS